MSGIRPYSRFGDRLLARCHRPRPCDFELVNRINARQLALADASDRELASRSADLRSLVDNGTSILDERVAVSGLALVKEAARRALGRPHYDVQLLAGIALASGAIAEMQTGEGKTLTSAFPVFLRALGCQGAHVSTVNSYLTQRDYDELRPVYEMLGLSVGLSRDGASHDEKRTAYQRDITYATGYELGFDFLRDEAARRSRKPPVLGQRLRDGLRGIHETQFAGVQRGHPFVVVDEVDSVLLDEANTPLILSGPTGRQSTPPAVYHAASRLADRLQTGHDYVLEIEKRHLRLTQNGADSIYAHDRGPGGLVRPWTSYVEQSLKANHLFQRNVHYVVVNDEIKIVDEYTGRIFDERTWRDGLHQAIEAKEGVGVTDEKCSLARVSRQRYFQLYDQLCGMTGTASGHEQELFNTYRLPIVEIPLRKPSLREQFATLYFPDEQTKWAAIVAETCARHKSGQPVLVGTRTIANSQHLADQLTAIGIPFQLLNGMQDADEAELVAQAGQLGMITIATNMAGRGTDIKPSREAIDAGGLHVIAAERHDSSRIDRQLIGRCARQGDPGSCRFFVSARDELISRHDPGLSKQLARLAKPAGTAQPEFDAAIERLQAQSERDNLEHRRRLMQQELWLNEVMNTVA